jgi:hypothetical protein
MSRTWRTIGIFRRGGGAVWRRKMSQDPYQAIVNQGKPTFDPDFMVGVGGLWLAGAGIAPVCWSTHHPRPHRKPLPPPWGRGPWPHIPWDRAKCREDSAGVNGHLSSLQPRLPSKQRHARAALDLSHRYKIRYLSIVNRDSTLLYQYQSERGSISS